MAVRSYGSDQRTDFGCVNCDLDIGDMTFSQGHDTPLGHGQPLRGKNIKIQHGSKELWPGTDFRMCAL